MEFLDSNKKWKPVIGFEGLYEVSPEGEIKSVDHYVRCNSGQRLIKGRILKQCDRGNGYPFVTMGKNGKQYNVSTHRAVAMAFIPNPNNYTEVNHIDCNPKNSNVKNLEWCNRTYNNHYGNRIEKAISKTSKKVLMIVNEEIVKTFSSLSEASKTTGITASNISMCCNGKRFHAGGYTWRYL